jgi:hypothetical protein
MRVGFVWTPIRIRIWIGTNMNIRILVGIKSMPIRHTGAPWTPLKIPSSAADPGSEFFPSQIRVKEF